MEIYPIVKSRKHYAVVPTENVVMPPEEYILKKNSQ